MQRRQECPRHTGRRTSDLGPQPSVNRDPRARSPRSDVRGL